MEKALVLHNVLSLNFASKKVKACQIRHTAWQFWLGGALLLLNLFLLTSYIYGVNKYAAEGYQIKILQNKVSNLTEENKKINLQVSEANSMVSIQSDFLNSNFVAAGTPKFLEINTYAQSNPSQQAN